MTDHCDPHCPFLGCASCAYKGGDALRSEGGEGKGTTMHRLLSLAAARRVLRSLPNPDTATREVKT